MLARRIIPCLDVKEGRVVKGKQFTTLKDVDAPETLSGYYDQEGADELVFYDITASSEARKTSLEFVERVAKTINIPFSVGGGVNTIDDFTMILRKGADKVSVNTGAVLNPELIRDAALKFGSQCVVLSIDAKYNGQSYDVYIKGGREKTELDAIQWAKKGVALGAGEIVINSIDTDGMKAGFNIDLVNRIIEAVNVPVIASGGAGSIEDFLALAKETTADGMLAASVFHYKEIRIKTLKKALHDIGIPIRVEEE